MSQRWLRVGGGLAAFLLVGIVGIARIDVESAVGAWSLATLAAVPAGIATYALIEYAQTRRLDSIRGQFDTRILVLMPVAMAVNIVLGTAVASALKIPVYLDSVGTILVAALGGPLAGALTGLLSNLAWTYLAPPPFQSPFAAPFAVVAVVVGLLAGTFARWGWLRPRPGTSGARLVVGAAFGIGLIALMALIALQVWDVVAQAGALAPESDRSAFLILGWGAMLLVMGTAIGLIVLLVRRRDLAAAWILVAGVVTGVAAALVAAPIAASLFGGVTGSGTDLLVAAFRQAGADIEAAVLGQALISDPIDKVIAYFVTYLVLGAMSVRTLARFPQGEHLLPVRERAASDDPPASDDLEVAR